jgi:5-(carboxyamino)imidazole ribonucleotide synthase
MGHVTIVNKDITEARRIAEDVKNTIRVIVNILKEKLND